MEVYFYQGLVFTKKLIVYVAEISIEWVFGIPNSRIWIKPSLALFFFMEPTPSELPNLASKCDQLKIYIYLIIQEKVRNNAMDSVFFSGWVKCCFEEFDYWIHVPSYEHGISKELKRWIDCCWMIGKTQLKRI